ncbi:MAG: DUF2281 domain-containing protein [Leptolyngbyaceae cyanobacterium RM2_2_4]|nr:DUF2281 domain-containing protein [Leptolyngbyaceae cyanobacterium SM1_4_3]NJO51001.1 DUF2281 domain-containing protein [Leptolyngbyaceae cyanobacterium RM2_2_4]
MTIRDNAITKLQQLSEPLLQEVNDFIDFLIYKHQVANTADHPDKTLEKTWSKWFEDVDRLALPSPDVSESYQQLLLDKYRQQGLEL